LASPGNNGAWNPIPKRRGDGGFHAQTWFPGQVAKENRRPNRLMTAKLARKMAFAPWLVALALLQSGCGAGRRLEAPPQAIDPLALIQTARGQLGVRYNPGGSLPITGFDCSGYTQWVFWQHGLMLPRQSYDQYQSGEKIKGRKLHAGDLVFFEIEKKGASHVGIYVDQGKFIHSSSTGGLVREDHLGEKYWQKRYLGARRVLP
jgi:murein DD-endopeptidase